MFPLEPSVHADRLKRGVKANMPVKIEITKKKYGFIDGTTGQEITAEEFAEKYPAVGLGRHRVDTTTDQTGQASQEN